MFLSEFLDYPESVVKLARVTGSEVLEAIFMLCACVCGHQYGRLLAHERIKTLEILFFCCWLEPELNPRRAASSHSCALVSPGDDKIHKRDLNKAFAACL